MLDLEKEHFFSHSVDGQVAKIKDFVNYSKACFHNIAAASPMP